MEKKKLLTLLIAAVLSFSLMITSAYAGSKHSYRRQGIAIGLGVAILGSALYRSLSHPKLIVPNAHVFSHPARRKHRHQGHWETRKEWILPAYKRVWNPGHYNRRGEWVTGHWFEIEDRPGYWIENRVWVSYNVGRR
ncbi:hypothetical protein ACFL9T_19915 [Thermodesulfobacteriota bacterium]